ncbi:MAG TPA: mechanosensitive ion channel family protein [Sphingobacteriaceae bacterium]
MCDSHVFFVGAPDAAFTAAPLGEYHQNHQFYRMLEILNDVYFGNTVRDYLISAGIIAVGFSVIRIFKKRFFVKIKQWSENTSNHLDDFIAEALDRFGIPALYFALIYFGISFLTLPTQGKNILKVAATVVITFLFIRLLSSIILMLLRGYVRRQDRGEEKVKQLAGLMLIVNVVIWIIGLLFLFDNMGYNVTAMVTGLGIGGIAVALAAQNILGDLFNYFVIFMDRPFEVNDFITIDDKAGTVENIGIKTTRLKSLSGEQLIFSNSDLTKSRIHNFKRMETRRIVFKVGVVYDTSPELLRQIPELLKEAVTMQPTVQFDRAHFSSMGDSSLVFEVVYIVLSAEYLQYMDIQQNINFYIFENFNRLGIEFAYPTTTVFFKRGGQPQGVPNIIAQ